MAVGFILMPPLYGRRSIAAAAWRLDHEHVAGGHLGLVERAKIAASAVSSQNIVTARRARFAARHAVRGNEAVPRENGCGHGLEKAHAPHGAVAAVPAPSPAGAVADLEALQEHGKAPFQHFGVGEARGGHVRLHHVRAVESGAGTRTATDRLAILVTILSDGE